MKTAYPHKKTFSDYGIEIPHNASNEVRTTCPRCSCARKKYTEKCLAVNINDGVWHCHHCYWSGGLGKDAKHEFALPEKPKRPTPTQLYAIQLWLKADLNNSFVAKHPYAIKKGITWSACAGRVTASGKEIGKDADCIIVPIRQKADGKVQAVQLINPEGKKQTFGTIKDACLVLGNTLDKNIPWYVAEGWASAVSAVFHHNHGNAVCGVAFGKVNMQTTAELMARVFEPKKITILGEQ